MFHSISEKGVTQVPQICSQGHWVIKHRHLCLDVECFCIGISSSKLFCCINKMTTVSSFDLHRPNQIFNITLDYRKYFPKKYQIIFSFVFYTKAISKCIKISKEYNQKFLCKKCSPGPLHFKTKYIGCMEMNKCMCLLIYCCKVGSYRITVDNLYKESKKRHYVVFR